MIKSMTGFGAAAAELKGKKITVEIRSLNSRQLDLNMRLSSYYREKESEVRQKIAEVAERGKIEFSIHIEQNVQPATTSINKNLVKAYYRELQQLSKELKVEDKNLLKLTLHMPHVFKNEQEKLEDKEWSAVKRCIDKALKEFVKFRADEGAVLAKDMRGRILLILTLLREAEILDEKRIPSVRERLHKGMAELKEKVDRNRFEQELIYYIEKLDITEEKVRLKTHCDYFLQTMKEENIGRKLAFIAQEIGREVNTIGSKANDAGIQKLVVQMKDELEKIKEQINNVL